MAVRGAAYSQERRVREWGKREEQQGKWCWK